jgi:hypothetical protein
MVSTEISLAVSTSNICTWKSIVIWVKAPKFVAFDIAKLDQGKKTREPALV